MNTATRTAGFGAEVKRRIMLGTYALSAGYYDAYYGQAQRVRTLDHPGLRRGLRALSTCCSAPTAPTTAFALGRQGGRPDDHVPDRRLHHPVQPGRPPGDQRALRHRATTACPVGVQVLAPALGEASVPGGRGGRGGRDPAAPPGVQGR